MHPIERLRYVARAEGAGPTLLGIEAAQALAGFQSDPAGLVTACRRLVDRHPEMGPVWWVAARALMAPDPGPELHSTVCELEDDQTEPFLSASLAEGLTAVVIGWPEQVAVALDRRADLRPLVVSSGGEGDLLARRLSRSGVDAEAVVDSGLGGAVSTCGLVLLEATAVGPDGFVAAAGSLAAAATARSQGVPVALVAGAGRVLPGRLWEALLARDQSRLAWESAVDVVPMALVDVGYGPDGQVEPEALARRGDCPAPPELLA